MKARLTITRMQLCNLAMLNWGHYKSFDTVLFELRLIKVQMTTTIWAYN